MGLYAYSPAGVLRWSFPADHGVKGYMSPVVDASGVIFIGDNMAIYAVSSTGTGVWKDETQLCEMDGSAVVLPRQLIVGCSGGRLLVYSQ